MLLQKLYVLEPEVPDKQYLSLVKPFFYESNISSVKYARSTLIYPQKDCDILLLDRSHWFWDYQTFKEYLDIVLLSEISAIGLIDCPYLGPISFDPPFVVDQLTRHYEILFNKVKKIKPDVVVLSPVLCALSDDKIRSYLDFFIKSRNFFDVYSLAIYHDFSDRTEARLNTFVSEVLKILRKDVWITHWAIPSVKDELQGIMTYETAAAKIRNSFMMVNALAGGQAKWFISALGKDGTEFPMDSLFYQHNIIKPYIGLLDSQGRVKQPIVKAFCSL